MKFKACDARKNRSILGVCEDFESKRNAEVRLAPLKNTKVA